MVKERQEEIMKFDWRALVAKAIVAYGPQVAEAIAKAIAKKVAKK